MTGSAFAGPGFLFLYVLCAAAAAVAAAWLRRPLPLGRLALFLAAPLAYLAPYEIPGRTLLPADHAIVTRADPGAAPTSVWTDDVGRQFIPWAQAVKLAAKDGGLPHRNRWNGCSMTLDGNGETAAYSPLTWIGLLLPLPFAFLFWSATRLFLCLTGTWLWLRELGVSPAAALFGAVSFGFGLAMTAWLLFPHTATLALGPWILWTIERLRDPSARRRAFALLTLLFTLLPLSGHIETAASVCAFAAVWLVFRWIAGERAGARAVLLAVAGAALLALGLSAFSLLPQALAIRASNRYALTEEPFWAPIRSWFPHRPASPWTPVLLLFPRALGDGISSPQLPGALASFPEMAQGFFGVVGAVLALLMVRPGSARPAAEKALLAPLLAGLLIAAGAWPLAEISTFLPGLGRMFPERYLVWVALAGAAMAAFELDRLERDLSRGRRAAAWPLALAAAGLLAAMLVERHLRRLHEATGGQPSQLKAYLLAGLPLVAAAAIVAATARRPRLFAAVGVPLLALVAAGELFRQGTRLLPPSEIVRLYPKTPLVRVLEAQSGTFRIVGEGSNLFPNGGIIAGVEDVRTHDPIERRDYVDFLDANAGFDPVPYYKRIRDVDAPALDFLNVRFLVADPGRAAPSAKWRLLYSGADGTLFENARFLPRAFSPNRIRLAIPSPRPPTGLDWGHEAVVRFDGPPPPLSGGVSVSDYAEQGNGVSFRTDAPRAGVVVTSLVDDGGWRARDDRGAAVRIGRANGPFLALAVPAGRRRIDLEYASPGFRAGARIALLAAAAALLLAAIGRARRTPRAAA